MEVQVHRGARSLAPENTIPSFEAAIKMGANVIEMDVHISKDGKAVIIHDFFLNPKLVMYADGRGLKEPLLIRELSFKQIKEFDCGLKKNPKFPNQQLFPGTTIPGLGELIDFIENNSDSNAKSIRLNIELKRDERHPEWSFDPLDFATIVLQDVKHHGFKSRVYYSSFDPEMLSAVRNIDPHAVLGFIYNADSLKALSSTAGKDQPQFLIDTVLELKVAILSPEHTLLKNREQVDFFHRQGFRIIPWTVNNPERWKELIDLGVDGIITDYPQDLIRYLK